LFLIRSASCRSALFHSPFYDGKAYFDKTSQDIDGYQNSAAVHETNLQVWDSTLLSFSQAGLWRVAETTQAIHAFLQYSWSGL